MEEHEKENLKKQEFGTKIRMLLEKKYQKQLAKANERQSDIELDFSDIDKLSPPLAELLLEKPYDFFPIAEEAIRDSLANPDSKMKMMIFNIPKEIKISDIRSKHSGKFISIEGIVRKASDVRPEIMKRTFNCSKCDTTFEIIPIGLAREMRCAECGRAMKEIAQEKTDARWVTVEEPFELTEGEKPAQFNCIISGELSNAINRKMSDVGNRLKMSGIVKEVPKEKSTRLEFYFDVNHLTTTEDSWSNLEITKEDEIKIKEMCSDDNIYQTLSESIAPSIYGMDAIKEAVLLQIFSGVHKDTEDGGHIRGDINILLVGDPSCLRENERVVLSDGSVMKIGKMGENHLDKIDYQVHVGKGGIRGQATEFHKFHKQPIMEIITETGKSIQGTYNQMVLIKENRERNWKRLDELKIGERVCVIPKIDCTKTALVETKWQDFPTKHESFKIKIPEYVDEKLASILGYVIGDGYIENDGRSMGFVVNKKKRDISKILIENFKKCFDVNVKPRKQNNNKINCYVIDRSHLCEILSILKEKRVPDLIWQSRNSVVASFLSWLYEADGCAFCNGRGRTAVSFKSSRLELLRDIQMLLLRFGIQSRIAWDGRKTEQKYKGKIIRGNGSGNLTIRRSESIIKFTENIGFIGKNKKKRLNKAYEYAKKSKHHIHSTMKESEKIKKINILEPQDVFDITVPEHERFVANGIIVHNSGKTSLMKIVSSVIPRAKYVSGTGSSQAGLTATVTKDDKFMGGWVLEAGALVLCNGSLLAVDEFEKMMVEDQVIFHESMESGCYDDKTEVLTRRGWKFFKDLDYDDEMATLSEKGELEYQRFMRYIKYPYKGEMYHFDSLKIDLLVTPNHNMFVNLHKRAGDFHGWGLYRADSLFGMNGLPKRLKFKRDANWLGKRKNYFMLPSILKHKNQNGSVITSEIKYKMNDWLEFLGYFVSEGSVSYQNRIPYRVAISQSKDKEKVDKIDKCIKRLDLGYSFDGNNFWINDKQLATYLSAFGKSRQKHIPDEYKNLSKEQLKILLDAMILGDGYISRQKGRIICGYVTSSKKLADDVQEITLKIGCSGTIHSRQPKNSQIKGRKIKNNGLIYEITLCGYLSPKNIGEPTINFQGQKNIIKRNYDGIVYCVEVPNHILYVRRNGYPVWCGNSVSIAKATIVATLPARTAILAGANPNMSRFDPFLPIVKQVSIPETLLSRFDLKFILKDKPNQENDRKLLKHIQSVRRNGNSTPKVSNIMLKKYISYAKAKCEPMMTDEAEEKLQEFYLQMRDISEKSNVMAITLRQFEALCRLSEASAKVQLSHTVRIEDAERAIRLMEASLIELGYDPKTKNIDIDRVEGNMPQSERGKAIIVINTISKLSKIKKDITKEELIQALSDVGIEWNYEIENILERLCIQGMIFRPTPKIIQKV